LLGELSAWGRQSPAKVRRLWHGACKPTVIIITALKKSCKFKKLQNDAAQQPVSAQAL